MWLGYVIRMWRRPHGKDEGVVVAMVVGVTNLWLRRRLVFDFDFNFLRVCC